MGYYTTGHGHFYASAQPKDLWKYDKKSTPDWNNTHLGECTKCSKMHECGGLFESNNKMDSQHINAF